MVALLFYAFHTFSFSECDLIYLVIYSIPGDRVDTEQFMACHILILLLIAMKYVIFFNEMHDFYEFFKSQNICKCNSYVTSRVLHAAYRYVQTEECNTYDTLFMKCKNQNIYEIVM